jgi:hypothetical protein
MSTRRQVGGAIPFFGEPVRVQVNTEIDGRPHKNSHGEPCPLGESGHGTDIKITFKVIRLGVPDIMRAETSRLRPSILGVDDDSQIRQLLSEVGDRAALDSAAGNRSLAARRLGVSRRALYRLIDEYGALEVARG